MELVMATVALAVPVLLGTLWMNLLIPAHTPARAALACGHGTLLGLLLVPQMLWR